MPPTAHRLSNHITKIHFDLFREAHAINNMMHLSWNPKTREKKSKDYFLVMPAWLLLLF